MKIAFACVVAALAAGCVSTTPGPEAPKLLTAVPAWNAKPPAETYAWFMDQEYGVRPKGADKPMHLKFSPLCPDRVMMAGAALRKRIRIEYGGRCGTNAFNVTAFVPRTPGPHPAFLLICNRKPEDNIDPERIKKIDFWPAEEIVARGYAAITFYNGEVAPDLNSGCTEGVFSCFDPKRPYRPKNNWGTLSAWAWGASRVMDWIETEPLLDAKRVAVVGHSRGGKTALLTGVTDKRFAMACVNDSGCSGAKLNRMDLPKSEHLCDICSVFPYWFCGNYIRWVNKEEQMPFDQHQFLALMAPRLVAVASATEDAWAGPRGEYECCVRASGAWEAQGKPGFVTDGFPAPDTAQQEGSVSYHLRTGKHGLTGFDWKCYMDFADRHGWRR